MTDIVYYVASSLDGFIATPDGGVEWLRPFEGGDDDHGYREFYESVDAVLVGRKTYEQALTFGEWPYPGKPAWVFSRRELPAPEADVVFTRRSPEEAARALRAADVGRAWLVGGAELATCFRAAGLITEYVVSVVPRVLGEGIPLFRPDARIDSLRLDEVRPFPSGIVQLRYRAV